MEVKCPGIAKMPVVVPGTTLRTNLVEFGKGKGCQYQEE